MNKVVVSLLVVVAAACGDNSDSNPQPDASITPDAAVTPARAVVVSGNFMPGQAGVMSALDVMALTVDEGVAPTGAIGDDPMLRKFDDELFVVNRADGNNVTILDATTFALKEQLATGAGSNPQDVAVVGQKLFVPAFGTAGVVVLTRGSAAITTIDLSMLDPDGKPDCISAIRVGTDVYVACELLDSTFTARGPGKVVVINSATNTVRTMVTLSSANPFGAFERLPDDVLGGGLLIPTVPSFGDLTIGCIERITPGTTPVANGCLVTNQQVAGFVNSMAFQRLGTTQMLWMVVNNGQFGAGARADLWGFDVGMNLLWPDPITPATEQLVDVAVCPYDAVVVADQAMAANGLRVYEGGIQKTTAPLAIGLKPGSSHGLVCY